jgi:hypothetical protein
MIMAGMVAFVVIPHATPIARELIHIRVKKSLRGKTAPGRPVSQGNALLS